MSDLKLCSYCGGEFNWRSCKCDKNADCPIHNVFIPLNKWNTRPLEDAKDARNEELEGALTELVQLANHPLTVDALDITQSTEMDRVKKLLAKTKGVSDFHVHFDQR